MVEKDMKTSWKVLNKKHKNFTDLGNYLIDIEEIDKFDVNAALEYLNNVYDFPRFGCTACATWGDDWEVIIGRNMDVYVSQSPGYVSHVDSGKYRTIAFSYMGSMDKYTYKALQDMEEIDSEYRNAVPFFSTDAMNEKGLYIEMNMRESNPYFDNSGTNPGKTRAPMLSICTLVAMNCSTVQEAVEFVKTQYDFYTINDGGPFAGWNLAFMVGDCEGEFGLIEIARNEVSYLQYEPGQGNYFKTPRWSVVDKTGSGHGRFDILRSHLGEATDEKSMLDLMRRAMWRNELLYTSTAYRDKSGKIRFVDDNGDDSLDWRSDYALAYPVDASGNLIPLTGHEDGYNAYLYAMVMHDKDAMEENLKEYKAHREYLERCDASWVSNDDHFEALQKRVMETQEKSGVIDLLKRYYAGDEDPLRDSNAVWTTSFSFAVNCKKKHLMLKLWEREDLIYEYQW